MATEIAYTSREFTKNGFHYTVKRLPDNAAEAPDRETTSAKRMAAWQRNEWEYIGIACDIRINTASNWADGGPVVGRASLWAIESDSGEKYLASVEADMIREAEAEIDALRKVLCGKAGR